MSGDHIKAIFFKIKLRSMAQFEGTVSEFTKYLGSFCRIEVMRVTTKYRKTKGKCEDCGTTENLEAAHIKGKERPLIISNILSQFIENDKLIIDLNEFQERFIEAHLPVENVIRILCRGCHREYDRSNPSANIRTEIEQTIEQPLVKESKEIEKLIHNTLNKSAAIDIINKKSGSKLNNANTLFSNINSAVDVWWLEPNNEKFKTGFDFLLNYPDNRTLFHFNIPGNIILKPRDLFYQRQDSDYSKIFIPKSESEFLDKKGFNFNKYLAGRFTY